MVRDELAMKDGEEYERMTGGLESTKKHCNMVNFEVYRRVAVMKEYERMTGGWRGLDWF